MRLTFLGAGAANSRRYQTTCSLLELGQGQRWLIDCGRQAPEQLACAGLSWHDIDAQLITHVHGDHVYGMEEFAFERFYRQGQSRCSILKGGPRPALVAHSAVMGELWETLAPSLRYLDSGQASKDGTLNHYFEPTPLQCRSKILDGQRWPEYEQFRLHQVQIRAQIVPHVPFKPSTSFELSWCDPSGTSHSVWWSGDTRVEPDKLKQLAEHCRVMFHDCSFAPKGGMVHGDFEELLALPEKVRRKIVLMHHDDDLADHEGKAKNAGFRVARPGESFNLCTGERERKAPTPGRAA